MTESEAISKAKKDKEKDKKKDANPGGKKVAEEEETIKKQPRIKLSMDLVK